MRGWLFRIAALAAVVALVAGGAVWWLGRDSDKEEGGKTYPKEWDARAEKLAEFVEEERGLEFEHPVEIEFLSEKDFRTEVTAEEADLDAEERKEIKQTEGLFRALGLLDHDVDLLDAANDARGGGVVGLYDAEDEVIRMRGTRLTPAGRKTLVHELTHVLQDQHYDLEQHDEDIEDSDDSATVGAIWDALVEGDASRVETAWAAELPADEQKELAEDEERQGTEVEEQLADVPPFLQTALGAPYVLGENLLDLVSEAESDERADELFRDPPTSEEQLLDPWRLLDGDEPVEVPRPELADDEKEFDDGTFGAPSLLFVLAERIPVKEALAATDGWGGDQYVAFERDGRSCIRTDLRADSPNDLTELRDALEQWVAAGPDGVASVTAEGKSLRLESCDPGSAAVAGNGGSIDALGIAVGRTAIAVAILEDGATADIARCFAGEFIAEFTIAEYEELNTDATPDQALLTRVQEAAERCR